MNNDNT